MNVLITGSEGFIGKNLSKYLWNRGNKIVPWDNKHNKPLRDFTTTALLGVDYVIHLAAKAGVRQSINEPDEYWETNVEGSKRLFDICYAEGVPVIYASSSNAKYWWMSPYATTKKAMEGLAYPGQIGLRFTTVYGPGSRPNMFITKLKNGTLKYVTEGHKRDFIHVEDVCSAIHTIMTTPNKDFISQILDVGTGTAYDIKSLATMSDQYNWEIKKGEPTEVASNQCQNNELRALGWEPTHSLYEYLDFSNDNIN